MDRITRWETEAMRGRTGRPRPRSAVIDLRRQGDENPAGMEPDGPPPGTLLVPLDAWQRMLDQLGNLHEAGQQLAEASARAAKAETEAEFLRERVADLRRQLAEAAAPAPQSDGDPVETERSDSPSTDRTLLQVGVARARSLYRTIRGPRSSAGSP
jgi:dsDNA-binding SOS-regulon protein